MFARLQGKFDRINLMTLLQRTGELLDERGIQIQ